jgi:hypothetical protein
MSVSDTYVETFDLETFKYDSNFSKVYTARFYIKNNLKLLYIDNYTMKFSTVK